MIESGRNFAPSIEDPCYWGADTGFERQKYWVETEIRGITSRRPNLSWPGNYAIAPEATLRAYNITAQFESSLAESISETMDDGELAPSTKAVNWARHYVHTVAADALTSLTSNYLWELVVLGVVTPSGGIEIVVRSKTAPGRLTVFVEQDGSEARTIQSISNRAPKQSVILIP